MPKAPKGGNEKPPPRTSKQRADDAERKGTGGRSYAADKQEAFRAADAYPKKSFWRNK